MSGNDSILNWVDVDDPFDVATSCLSLTLGVLAICRPRKRQLNVLGVNKLDAVLSGMHEALKGKKSARLRKLDREIRADLGKSAGGEAKTENVDLTVPVLRCFARALELLVRKVASSPAILSACERRALSNIPVTVGSLVARSGHSAAIGFGQAAVLAMRAALEGGLFLRHKSPPTKDELNVEAIESRHVTAITERLQDFPEYDSPEVKQLMATIVLENEQASSRIPPGFQDLWPKFTPTERKLISKIWEHRRREGFRSADLYPLLGWESLDSEKNFGVHQANIKKKLREDDLRLPWNRSGGRIFWRGFASEDTSRS